MRAQPAHVDARCALGRSRGDRRLQRLTKVEQLDHVTLVLRQVADDPARELRAVRPSHLRAPPLAAVHEAFQRQLVDRLADEAAGNAERAGRAHVREAGCGRAPARPRRSSPRAGRRPTPTGGTGRGLSAAQSTGASWPGPSLIDRIPVWYGCLGGPTIGPRTYHSRSYASTNSTTRMPELSAEPLVELISRDGGGRGARVSGRGVEAGLRPAGGRRCSAWRRGCASAGVGRGGRVAVVLPNGPEIIELLFALAAARRDNGPAQPRLHRGGVQVLPGRPGAAAPGGRGGRGARRPRCRGRAGRSSSFTPTMRAEQPRLEMDGRPLRAAGFERDGPTTPCCCCTQAGRPRGRSRCRCSRGT